MTGRTTEQKLIIAETALEKIRAHTAIAMRYPSEDPLFLALHRIHDHCERVLAEVGKP